MTQRIAHDQQPGSRPMPPAGRHGRLGPSGRGAALAAGLALVAALVAALTAPGPAHPARADALLQATPVATCGAPATGWSEALAGGVRGRLARVRRDQRALPDDPPGTVRLAARLALVNEGEQPLALPPGDFSLVACDGSVHPAVADPNRRPLPEEIAPGDGAVGWVVFALPEGTEPALIVFRLADDGACRALLIFPLAAETTGVEVATPAATPEVVDPLAPCAGGSAAAGIEFGGDADDGAAEGADGAEGTDGADGADATGPDATGGDGCPGEDATGPNATGGDGGDGGSAIGDGTGGSEIGFGTVATPGTCPEGTAG